MACLFFVCLACQHRDKQPPKTIALQFIPVDISKIPFDTVSSQDKNLRVENGIYFFKNKPFSGFILRLYDNQKTQYVGSFLQGKQHGISRSFYESGKPKDERSYQDNMAYGRHIGFWENGKMQFDFFYLYEKSHGKQRQWYVSGQPYLELNYEDDKEVGMQKAWRENGKLFANYEVRDGVRYGLQKTALCYTLKDGKFK